MNSNSRTARIGTFTPDGLDEKAIDGLIAEVGREVVEVAAPTSALLDGSAAERRRRRIERRMLADVVRSLPVRSFRFESAGDAA